MATDINVQDTFLEKVKNEKSLVAVYFEKIKIIGTVKDYDQFSITLDSNGQEQMVYKQGINYISLQKPKKSFRPRPSQPREGYSENKGEGFKKPFSPRPRPNLENRGDFNSSEERRFDNSDRKFDSQNQSSYKGSREGGYKKNFEQNSDSSRGFRPQKPYPKKD